MCTFQPQPRLQLGGGASKVVLGTYEESGDVSFRTFSREVPTDFSDEQVVLLEGRYATQEEIDSGAFVAIIEQTRQNNIAMYEHFLTLTDEADVIEVFKLLKAASESHLESFMMSLQRQSAQ